MYSNQTPNMNSKPLTHKDIKGSESRVCGKNQVKQDSNQLQNELNVLAII